MRDILDSRVSLGSDVERLDSTVDVRTRADVSSWYSETSSKWDDWVIVQSVRVVVGRFGGAVRLTAADIDIVTEGDTFERAWSLFLEEVRRHPDAPWLFFDVGPTRHDEIEAGLDVPEDEDWAEPAPASGND